MKNEVRTTLLLLGDLAVLSASFLVMLSLRFWGILNKEIVSIHFYPFLILAVLQVIILFIFDLYDTETAKPTIPHLSRIVGAFIISLLLGITLFYTIPFFNITPKTNLLVFIFLALIFFILWRRIFYNIFSAHFKKNVVFISNNPSSDSHVKDLTDYISTYPQSGFQVAGKYNSLEEYERENNTSTQVLIIAREIWRDNKNFKKLNTSKILLLDLAHAYEDILGRIPLEAIDEGWFMHNIYSDQKNIYFRIKKLLSILFAIFLLIISSPFLLLAAFFIKIHDKGPVFYSQTRVGKNGQVFKLYKLRSMDIDAEKNGPEWSSKGDARVTPAGKVLRKLHLDEIPQMWNILKGDISLVGPRPERPEFVAELEEKIPFYYLRHTITPGFTGWAQIKFRYARSIVDSKDKFEYDLYYIKNRNIFMDFGIFLRTIQIIFTH